MKPFCTVPYDSEVKSLYGGYPETNRIGYYRPAKLRGYQDLIESKFKTEEIFTKTLPELKDGIIDSTIYIEFTDNYIHSQERESLVNRLL